VPDPLGAGSALAWPFVCLVAAAAIWLPDLAAGRWPSTPLDWPIAAYLATVAVSAWTSVDRRETLLASLALGAQVAVFYATVATARKNPAVAPAIVLILVAAIALLQIMAFAYHAGVGFGVRPNVYPVPPGWSGYPQLGLLGVVQIGFLIAGFQTSRRALALGALAVLILVAAVELIFLYARTAWLAVAAMIVVAPLVSARVTSLVRLLAVVVVLAVLTGGLMAASPAFRYLARGVVGLSGEPPPGWKPWEVGGPEARTEVWARTVHLIRLFPARGVGLGNFRRVFESNFQAGISEAGKYRFHAHNLWLHQAAEVGIAGGVCYLGIWLVALWQAWRAARAAPGFVTLSVLLAIVGIAASSVINHMFFLPGDASGRLYSLTWMLFALAVAERGGRRVSGSMESSA